MKTCFLRTLQGIVGYNTSHNIGSCMVMTASTCWFPSKFNLCSDLCKFLKLYQSSSGIMCSEHIGCFDEFLMSRLCMPQLNKTMSRPDAKIIVDDSKSLNLFVHDHAIITAYSGVWFLWYLPVSLDHHVHRR